MSKKFGIKPFKLKGLRGAKGLKAAHPIKAGTGLKGLKKKKMSQYP